MLLVQKLIKRWIDWLTKLKPASKDSKPKSTKSIRKRKGMPTAPKKAMAEYTPAAMKAEADELASIKLMEKAMKAEEEAKKAAKKTPENKALKPMKETNKLLKKMAKGGDVSATEAVHKHERAKHKGQPLTKMATGGTASKRGDGIAQRGKTKGKML